MKMTHRLDDDFSRCFSFLFLFFFSALLSALSSEGSGYVPSSFNFCLFLASLCDGPRQHGVTMLTAMKASLMLGEGGREW